MSEPSYEIERVPKQIASLLKENNDLLSENNVVHREHMKSEKKLLRMTIVLAILTGALLIVAFAQLYKMFFP